MTQADQGQQRPDPMYVRAIECATMVQESQLWPDEQVDTARRRLMRGWGHIPTLEQLAERFDDPELVRTVATQVVSARLAEIREVAERLGHGSPCHLCGAPRGPHDPFYDFGLAEIIEDRTEWGRAGATFALNLLTLPLGFAVGATPGRRTQAKVARCTLVMCEVCGRQLGGFLGSRITQEHCSRHPSWNRLVSAGFNTFLAREDLAKYR
ncbi:MAG: hypothetical protein R3B48_10815 [Kofleriaceae bacterium]